MKNILIVTYVFPPYSAVGGFRIIKFCKYMRDFGLNPSILTPRKPDVMAYDENLVSLIDPEIQIYKTSLLDPFRRKPIKQNESPESKNQAETTTEHQPSSPSFIQKLKRTIRQNMTIPDRSYFWSYCGLKQGMKAIKNENIDLILTSSPPQSVHLLGKNLATLSGKPLVVDFRDLWTQNTGYDERNYPDYIKNRDRRMEKRLLQKTSGITVATQRLKEQLLEKNDFLTENKIAPIYNGVDPDDFMPYLKEQKHNDKFTMLFSGSLYSSHRNPIFFFSTLQKWIDAKPHLKDKIKLKFIGNWEANYHAMLEKTDVIDIIEKMDWMPQSKMFEHLISADLLLLFQGFDPVLNSTFPRKLFEYLITNKDIMAFAPPGEITKAMDKYNSGVCFSSDDPQPIIAYLETALKKWELKKEQHGDFIPTLREMPELETKSQVEKLAEFCHSIL